MHSVNYNCVFIVPSRLVWQQSSIGSLCVCVGGGGHCSDMFLFNIIIIAIAIIFVIV